MSPVRSFGDLLATDSMSPWNTRKFLALTKIPYVLRRSAYSSAVHTRPSTRYSPVPEAVMWREKKISSPSSVSKTSFTDATRRSSRSARSKE